MRAMTLIEVVVSTALLSLLIPLASFLLLQSELSVASIARDATIITAHLQLTDQLQRVARSSSAVSVDENQVTFTGDTNETQFMVAEGKAYVVRSGDSTVASPTKLAVTLTDSRVSSDAVQLILSWQLMGDTEPGRAFPITLTLP